MAETYTGQVQNGVIVLDEGTPPLPEGTKVRIETDATLDHPNPSTPLLELIDRLDKIPGDPDWPTDAAAQHDHYLYGSRKRP
jgi:hypothetical protein